MIGDPVGHSLSPVLHNAAYEAMSLDWVYVALPVAAGRAGAAVEGMRSLGFAGMSVTMPHKAAVAAAVDLLTPTARRLGVVNTVSWSGGDLVGDSTDGPGFVDALRSDHHWSPAGQSCGVLGTGGAARAVVLALAQAGASRIVVAGRRRDAAEQCAALAGPAGQVGAPQDAADSALVVDATPVGMHGIGTSGQGGLPFELDTSRFTSGQLIIDLVYSPPLTPLLAAAAAQGATVGNGLGMLVHQAARQIAVWTGGEPPRDVMFDAATKALHATDPIP